MPEYFVCRNVLRSRQTDKKEEKNRQRNWQTLNMITCFILTVELLHQMYFMKSWKIMDVMT